MSLLYPLPETPADVVRAELQAYLQTDESYRGAHLEYWDTTKSGTHVVAVFPDRRVSHVGVLWLNKEQS